ncbi:unnamed protein product [Tilletia caries]|uniref:ATP-dependent DNA helicase n=1 Tax=Tilletia caries TaxID=13290 RepID=A0ABN7JBB5_9BASI|nr:unnamed protein product [Tilletia caries]
MVKSQDIFSPTTTPSLKCLAVAYFPSKGASRMNRPALVELFLQGMADEEVQLYEKASRRRLEELDDISHLLPVVHRQMQDRYGDLFPKYLQSGSRTNDARLSRMRDSTHPRIAEPAAIRTQDSASARVLTVTEALSPEANVWPKPIDKAIQDECMSGFLDHTNLKAAKTCAVCARRTFSNDLLFTKDDLKCSTVSAERLDLDLLAITDPHVLARPEHHFEYGHPSLKGLALERAGVHIVNEDVQLDVCGDCLSSLTHDPPTLPGLALANGNLRGVLPDDLQDITWLEERLCAKYLASAYVIRLYDLTSPGAAESRPRVMKGHACSFPLNTVSTAVKLPWAFGDGGPILSCIVIGPRKPRREDLRKVFKVRRNKVLSLMKYLRTHFKDYPQIPIDEEALLALPENDVPELIMRHVIYEARGEVPSLFDQETAGLEQHPALIPEDAEDEDPDGGTFLEHHGTIDINGVSIPVHYRTAVALANATGTQQPDPAAQQTDSAVKYVTGTERPDLVIKHGTKFVQEYNNPGLFPGMFPTLFPWGVGGFEGTRTTPLSFNRQATYLLDLAQNDFRRHWSYIFIVANIKQRRAVHLGTRLACKARDHEHFTTLLAGLDSTVVKRVSQRVARGEDLHGVTGVEGRIFSLLKKCELVSAMVPGSKAIMNRARADIRAYIGEFGIFQLFLTLNPSPTHSPVFQVFFGDETVDLEVPCPTLPSASARAKRVADDPVAAADYFHFHLAAVFHCLLGWDMRKKKPSAQGGILGELAAYFLVKEFTMRGQLHSHCLLWLKGGLNPSTLRAKLRNSDEFRARYLQFFDDLIAHELPPSPTTAAPSTSSEVTPARFPRQERPPHPSDPDYALKFAEDHRLLGEAVQRHRCTFTCFKGGRDSCRFLFPHELNEHPAFDAATNSVYPRIRDGTVNWHNPLLLVATRHNHDLKAVQSGKSGVAAASYITSYATKSDETPANQILMINTVYERMDKTDTDTSDAQALLSRCVMQFGRERQLHAQQAVSYVRDLGDTLQSHKTVPMLSGRLVRTALQLFGPARQDSGDPEPEPAQQDADRPATQDAFAQGEVMLADNAMELDGAELEAEGGPIVEASNGAITHEERESEDAYLLPLNNKGMAHQVEDYLHRGDTLADLTFYDFVRCCKIIKKPRRWNKNHHPLGEDHANVAEHCHRYAPDAPLGIPRAIFSSFPRSNGTDRHGDSYCSSMLAHFIPFSEDRPLKQQHQTWEQVYADALFSTDAQRIMSNWAALTECEDARDDEQLCRRKREAARSFDMDADITLCRDGDEEAGADNPNADVDMELLTQQTRQSKETLSYMSALAKSGWFDSDNRTGPGSSNNEADSPVVSFDAKQRRRWTAEQDILEAQTKADLSIPKATQGILAEQLDFEEDHAMGATNSSVSEDFQEIAPPPTRRYLWTERAPNEMLDALATERNLKPSQALAFTMAGRRFLENLSGVEGKPLRLLMHGEAGTGKTVVVRLLRELMDRFGQGKTIMFMAPTGKAAAAIGGTTQHSAFGLDVQQRGLTTDELNAAPASDTGRRIRFLQDKFKNVKWLFFDEVSMTSCEVLAEIDHALRVGTQQLDEPFGGVNVLFAGDLCQLPPVLSSPLYSRASITSLSAEQRTKVELGRAAWLQVDEVVEFHEQMRMQDAGMAAALSRLRIRACTHDDVNLFNSNVLRSTENPTGVEVKGRGGLVVLARTNATVRALNERKASVQASMDRKNLTTSHAIDKSSVSMDSALRRTLLSYNGQSQKRKIGAARLPLYIGMPIVYRGRNASICLGVTNGAFGSVAGWDVSTDKWGHKVATGAVIRFDEEAQWSLTGLQPGCLPVYPATTSFSFKDEDDVKHSISRRQLPLQPRFAMTVHSAQGMTSKGGVAVELSNGGFEAGAQSGTEPTPNACQSDQDQTRASTLEVVFSTRVGQQQ